MSAYCCHRYSDDASWTASLWLYTKMAVLQNPDHPCTEYYQTQISSRSNPYLVALRSIRWGNGLLETLTRFGLGWIPVLAQTLAQSVAIIWNELPLTAKLVVVPAALALVAMILICRRKSTSFGFRASLTRGTHLSMIIDDDHHWCIYRC